MWVGESEWKCFQIASRCINSNKVVSTDVRGHWTWGNFCWPIFGWNMNPTNSTTYILNFIALQNMYVHIFEIHAIFHLICRMLSLVYFVYILPIFNFNSQNSWAGSLLYVMDGCFIYSRLYMVSIDSIWYWYWWNGKWLIWIHGINNSEQTTTLMTYINLYLYLLHSI